MHTSAAKQCRVAGKGLKKRFWCVLAIYVHCLGKRFEMRKKFLQKAMSSSKSKQQTD